VNDCLHVAAVDTGGFSFLADGRGRRTFLFVGKFDRWVLEPVRGYRRIVVVASAHQGRFCPAGPSLHRLGGTALLFTRCSTQSTPPICIVIKLVNRDVSFFPKDSSENNRIDLGTD
jgi:hypothetical protein